MKKIFCILLASALLISLCSCKSAVENASKESVNKFVSVLNESVEKGLIKSYGNEFVEEQCFNVTPALVAEETDMQIFKFSENFDSFVMIDNAVYPVCDYFGGYGFVNAVPCDFDNDGNKDLLVASSSGSGVHRCSISVFNSVSKDSTTVYSDISGEDLLIDAVKDTDSKDDNEDVVVQYLVHLAKVEIDDSDPLGLSFVSTDTIGEIINENGRPTFKAYS